jgi:hypothetical protein
MPPNRLTTIEQATHPHRLPNPILHVAKHAATTIVRLSVYPRLLPCIVLTRRLSSGQAF